MSIILRPAYSNELYHHGIQGQKWGVTNGPPYPLDYGDHTAAEKKHLAKRYTKELNEHDKAQALKFRDMVDASTKATRTKQKIEKLEAKQQKKETNRRTKKIEKLKEQQEKELKVFNKNKNDWYESVVYGQKYVDNLTKTGYTIGTKSVSRNVTKGREYVGMLLTAGIQVGAAMAGVSSFGIYRYHSTPGTKYKVKA